MRYLTYSRLQGVGLVQIVQDIVMNGDVVSKFSVSLSMDSMVNKVGRERLRMICVILELRNGVKSS